MKRHLFCWAWWALLSGQAGRVVAASLLAGLIASPAVVAVPSVVVSIAPLHSLVAGVMAGVSEAELLLRGYTSPHAYQLKPSQAAQLSDADIVFWIGPDMETFLRRPLRALRGTTRTLGLMDAPGIELLPNRVGGPWEEEGHAFETAGEPSVPHAFDPHLWLDPANAKHIVRAIAEVLIEIDPASAAAYRRNAVELERRIDELDVALGRELASVRDVPYVVFHDAFQYLEHRYRLNAVGSVVVRPDLMPSARRIVRLRAKVLDSGARCVFSEPQFRSSLLPTIVEGTELKSGILDPIGATLIPGPDLYFELMRRNASALVDCLGG